jgi:drug/metabolite transporter (DMT)-like permease
VIKFCYWIEIERLATGGMRKKGIYAALASAAFLGMAPVFGKQAIRLGMPWHEVVALRTLLAASLLFVVLLITRRAYLYIYAAGLMGCMLAGGINGLGSLFYYAALGRINASLGQLLYSLYPLFLVIWLWLDHQPPSRITLLRLFLVLPAIYLLTRNPHSEVDFLGVLMMLAASALYALHLPVNQRVLFEMPAPTVTLYTLLSMSAVVVPVFLFSGNGTFSSLQVAWPAVMGLTMVTFLSRLTLFFGVKNIGGMQTAILGLGELLVTILISYVWLGERLNQYQWLGALLLVISLGMISLEKPSPRGVGKEGWLSWIRPPVLPKDFPFPHD